MAATIKPIDGRSVHQIQSGQVIVDLCSVAKELVENSVDAGATNIDVRFKNQGLDLIEVQDNGSGIAPANYASVALKHHTSKLSSYSDIASLQTFGFRGEALASLCALSALTVTTCLEADVPKGSQLTFEPTGKLGGTTVVAAQRGTIVSVEKLFHNLPVRRRELERNIKREWHKVVALLNQYACIQTGLKFSVSQQPTKGKRILLFSTKGNPSTRDNIINIFGAKTMSALVPLDIELEMQPSVASSGPAKPTPGPQNSSVKVRVLGHVSRPSPGDGRQTPDRQMFFVNGRPCGLPQFAKTFNDVYRSYNYSQSPFILADIRLDTHMYDVNVSPDKRTILLHDQGRLLDSLRSSLAALFDAKDHAVPISQIASRKSHLPIETGPNHSSVLSFAEQELGSGDKSPDEASRSEESGGDSSDVDASDHSDDGPNRVLAPRKLGKSRFLATRRTVQDQGLISRWLRKDETEGSKQPASGLRVQDPISGGSTTGGSGVLAVSSGASSAPVVMPISNHRRHTTSQRTGERHSSPEVRNHNAVGAAAGPFSTAQFEHVAGSTHSSLSEDAPPNEASKSTRHGHVTVSTDVEEIGPCAPLPPDSNALTAIPRASPPLSPDPDLGKDRCFTRSTSPQALGDSSDRPRDVSEASSSSLPATAKSVPSRLSRITSPQTRPPAAGMRQGGIMATAAQWLRLNQSVVRTSLVHLLSARSTACVQSPEAGDVEDIDSSDAESKLTLIISKGDFQRMRVVGQFNLGFIIATRPAAVSSDEAGVAGHDELFIIDQHASDEKYNFERLQTTTNVQSQRLVHPKRLQLTALEEEIVMANSAAIEANGFEVHVDASGAVGSRCQVVALPLSRETTFTLDDLQELISLLGEESAGSNYVPRPSKVRKMFAMRACRSSIMIGKALTASQMTGVLRHMGELDKPWNCPHGRPTMRHLCRLGMWDGRGWKGDVTTAPLATWRSYGNGEQ